MSDVLSMPLDLLPVDRSTLVEATAVVSELGLLTNDAIIVALARRHGIEHLVTNDADFLHVPDLRVWMPR